MSHHYEVHFKYLTILFLNYTWMKLKKKYGIFNRYIMVVGCISSWWKDSPNLVDWYIDHLIYLLFIFLVKNLTSTLLAVFNCEMQCCHVLHLILRPYSSYSWKFVVFTWSFFNLAVFCASRSTRWSWTLKRNHNYSIH